LTISDVTAAEGNSGTTAFNFTVTLSAPPSGPDVTVDWYTSSGTAIPGPDYTGGTGTLVWTTDDPPTMTITIQVNGDTVVESDEAFTVRLQNPVNATISSGVGTGTIANDDAAVVPTVTTAAPVTNITATTATAGGNVSSDGGSPVTDRGVCWSLNPNPTIAGACTHDATGTGSFTSSLTGLTPATLYYVRAYATNSAGTAYDAADVLFTTAAATTVPTVSTTAVSAITQATANSGGNVTSDGGSPVTDRGVCWSTTANPTTADACTSNGPGTGSFACAINGLTPGATYHVRAYATNSVGTAYGNDLQFAAAAAAGTVDVPTMGEWGMIIFILCAGLAAVHRMRRGMPE